MGLVFCRIYCKTESVDITHHVSYRQVFNNNQSETTISTKRLAEYVTNVARVLENDDASAIMIIYINFGQSMIVVVPDRLTPFITLVHLCIKLCNTNKIDVSQDR
ncbi:hypothetical protein EWB00_003720 [Schistosoma japonicum]|uniref:Uncharacterized protein n=1 Tax=Schistosoma japonicum TaxID=6182 RepID=A0A4Z2D7G3_SCHJA|nr:hypothetical protein KSF78_0001775 [Schistosoma japonicum]TNN12437.1 hypothetical protein EWB00_003720 [Schistosoma japonicum]